MKNTIKTCCLNLLLGILILAGCSNPALERVEIPASNGTGTVSVRIGTGEGAARTLAPANLPEFSKYTLTFTGPTAHDAVDISSSTSASVELAVGTWTITATAYTGATGSYTEVARGSASVTVNAGSNAPADIMLAPLNEVGTGTFRYSIGVPYGTTASFAMVTADGELVDNGDIYLPSGYATGDFTLPSGQYLMNVRLMLDEKAAGRTEVVHIYPDMITEGVYSFTVDDFMVVVSLSEGDWIDGASTTSGDVKWYSFIASEGSTYQVQWNTLEYGDGTKTLPYANVSAFRAGNYIFGASDGWTSPRTVSGVTGTVYLKVEAGDTGTYAIKYYDSTLMRPQESMTIYSVVGTPSPSCVISWNYVSGVIGYHLYRSDSLSGSYAPIADITEWWNTWNISYTDTSVSLGSTYYYKVAAYNTIGEGQLSAAISGTPPASSAITALSDNTWTDGEIVTPVDVKWYSFTASEGSTYQVQWNTRYNGDGTYTLPYANVSAFTADGDYIFYPTSDGWTYPQTVSGVTGTVYLKVEAGGSAGTYAIRYYDPTSLPPQAAMNIYSVNATPAPSCVIEWNYVDGVIGYRLYRSDSLDGVYAQIGADITGYDNNFYTDLGVSAGSTYYYKVAAYNANGEGERSAAVSGTPIGMFTMTGTLAVTVNGMALNFSDGGSYRLIAYADAYNDNIGEASPSADGAWTMAIRERYDGTMVYFGLIFGNDGLFFKLGSKMASTNPIALSGTFTTKTISGTVKDGATPVMAQVMLLDGTADTFDALLEKLQSGEIAYIASTSSESGLWTISVLDDVADAYILVENFISDSSVHGYITKNKVTLTAGAAINLVIGEMNDIGVYDY